VLEVTVTSPESCKRVLAIKAPYNDFKETIEKAFVKYQKELHVPGFRKGKVPMDIVRTRYKSAIESEALPDIIYDLIDQATKEHQIMPINRPKVDDLTYNEGKDIAFKAEVEVRPEVEIKQYKKMKVEKKKVEVSKEDVDNYLKYIQDSHGQAIRVSREATTGDYLVAEFQEMDRTGVPLIGKKTEKREYRIGDNLFGADFDQKLAGIKAGEQRIIRVIVPKDYQNKEVAGQEICFQVKALEVLEKKVPALDDTLAKELGYEDYKKFTADAEKRLLASRESQEKERYQNELMTEIIKANPFDLPSSMIENYLGYLLESRKKYNPRMDEKAFLEGSRPYAVFQIKQHLIIDQIAKLEKLEATDADIDAHVEKTSDGQAESKQKFADYLKDPKNRERLLEDLTVQKVLDFLAANAVA
jgi:trigger factor